MKIKFGVAFTILALGVIAQQTGLRRAPDEPALGRLARLTLLEWPVVAATTTVLYVLQENLERLRVGAPAPGIAALWDPSSSAIVVIAAVGLVVAFVGALFAWKRAVLVARIRAGSGLRYARPVEARRPAERADQRPASVLGRSAALRAPPAPAAPLARASAAHS